MSKEKLTKKIHVSRQSISNWENERNYPDIDNKKRFWCGH